MGFYRKKIEFVNFERINEILKHVEKQCINVYYRAKFDDEEFKQDAFIDVKATQIEISYKPGLKAITYIFKLDNEEQKHFKTGGDAFRIMNQYAKVQRYDNPDKVGSARQLLFKNQKYAGKRVKAFQYDLNSAFNYMLLKPIPDITTLQYNTYTKEGQIGFRECSDKIGAYLDITFDAGVYCEYVCDLMPSPFGKFVENWYKKKRNAKTKEEKIKAKDVLVMCIGQCQNINPFLRACVVGRCNKFIESLIDENTIYSNTDCIVSLVRRPDLEKNIGLEIGQWKLERENEYFAWAKDKINYQWNFEIPTVRGISKGWFKKFNEENKKPFDILKDTFPTGNNFYCFDKKLFRIVEV